MKTTKGHKERIDAVMNECNATGHLGQYLRAGRDKRSSTKEKEKEKEEEKEEEKEKEEENEEEKEEEKGNKERRKQGGGGEIDIDR